MTQQIKLSAALVAELVDRRQHGRVGPLLSQRPDSLPAAFATQQAVASLLSSPIIGWKCGMPSSDRWVLAPLFQTELQTASTCQLWPSNNGLARVEPELCFVLKQPLPARVLPYSAHEIDAAIGSTHLALELIQSRYATDSGALFLDQLADGLFNQGLWLGPKIHEKEPSEFELSYQIDVPQAKAPCVNDQQVESLGRDDAATAERSNRVTLAGKHPNQAPRLPIYWLVNFLSAHQIDLRAGQMIITGSYAGVLEFPFDTPIQLQFGSLGCIELVFGSRATTSATT